MENFDITKMSKFDFLKLKYIAKLGYNEELYDKACDYLEERGLNKIDYIISDPENERELTFAEAFYKFFSSVLDLNNALGYEDVREIPIEENYGIKKYIELIEALRNGGTAPDFWNKLTPEECARADYELDVSTYQHPYDVSAYICREAKVGGRTLNATQKLDSYMERLTRRAPITNDFDVNDDKQLDYFIRYTNEFSKLVKSRKVNHISDCARISKRIASLFK